jgi:NAD(P)-dependent dehydrogenase (short-subunit alcohol dehydrogenase family)
MRCEAAVKKLEGKVALVTGASSGIGRATAKLYREHGARVVATGMDPHKLEALQQELGKDALVVRSDAARIADIGALMQQIGERFGRLDVMFLNAGTATAAPVDKVTEQLFDEIVGVNFKGVFFTVQQALPLMQPGASIIATTSITNQLGSPNFSIYGASKAALRSLVQSLGLALIERGIRVNAISPGPIATPIFDRFGVPPEVMAQRQEEMVRKSPIKRFGTPDEIAKVALFLAADDASYLVGEEIVVDGGMSLL